MAQREEGVEPGPQAAAVCACGWQGRYSRPSGARSGRATTTTTCAHASRTHRAFAADDEREPLLRNPRVSQLCPHCGSTVPHPDPIAAKSSSSKANMDEKKPDDTSIRIPVYVLVMTFAISSWIDINGLFVQLPLLVSKLPEHWNLPSYLAVIIQVANVGPIVYTIVKRCSKKELQDWAVVYVIIGIGGVACILLSVFWQTTTQLMGVEHSTALLILSSFLALVDCTSSVVFLPYMALYKTQYMTAFYVGEGLSGLLPATVGLVQGVGSGPECINSSVIMNNDTAWSNHTATTIIPSYRPPRFGVEGFFFFLFAMICLSGMAFTMLHFLPYCKSERVSPVTCYTVGEKVQNSTSEEAGSQETHDLHMEAVSSSDCDDDVFNGPLGNHESSRHTTRRQTNYGEMCTKPFVFLLLLTAWANALTNGVIPPTQTFSCLPYGQLAYTLAIQLSMVANPVACFVALFLPTKSLAVIAFLTMFGTGLSSYQIYLAAMSPDPPLKEVAAGQAIVIVSQILLVASLSYVKVTTASMLNQLGGKTALLWCGIVTQLGSFTGAIVTFVLVNVLSLFTSQPPCPA